MRTIDNIVGLGTAAIIAVSSSVGYAANQQVGTLEKQPQLEVTTKEFTDESIAIPSSILQKFDELIGYPSRHISRCSKGDKIIWLLNRSTGFIGDSNYYSQDGKHLGEVRNSDTDHHTRKKPPVNLSDYKCTVVKSFVYKIQEKPQQ